MLSQFQEKADNIYVPGEEDPRPVSISDKTSYYKTPQAQSCEICIQNCTIALKFDRHLGISAVHVAAKFQSDEMI